MNTKTTKFLAVLAVLAMAFAAFAVVAPSDEGDAADQGTLSFGATVDFNDLTVYYGNTATKAINKGTPGTGEVALGNDIMSSYTAATETTPEKYVLTGTLATTYVNGTLGMTGFYSNIVFNQTIQTTDNVYLKIGDNGTWTQKTKFSSSATVEPWMIGIDVAKMSAEKIYIAAGSSAPASDAKTGFTEVDISGLTYAKEVTTVAGLYDAIDDSKVNAIIVNAASALVLTKDLSTTKPIFFAANYGITNGTDASGNTEAKLYKITASFFVQDSTTGANKFGSTVADLKATNMTSESKTFTIVPSGSTATFLNVELQITDGIGIDLKGTIELTKNAGIKNYYQLFNNTPLVAGITAGTFKIQAPAVDGPVTYTLTDATATIDVKITGRTVGDFLKAGDVINFNKSASGTSVITIAGTFILPAGATLNNNATVQANDANAVFTNYGKIVNGSTGVFSTKDVSSEVKFENTSVAGSITSSNTTTDAAPNYYSAAGIAMVLGVSYTESPATTGQTNSNVSVNNYTGAGLVLDNITIGADKAYTVYGGTVNGNVTLTANGSGKTTFSLFGATYTGTLTGPTSGVAEMSGVNGTLKFSAGSIAIEGEWDAGTMTVTGAAKLTGDVVMSAGTLLILNEGATLDLNGKTLTVESGAKVQGYGTIDASDATSRLIVENSSDVDVNVTYPAAATAIGNYIEIEGAAQLNNVLVLSAEITIPTGQTVTLPAGVTLYMNGFNIIVNGEFDVNEAKILRGKPVGDATASGAQDQTITVNGSFVLITADVKTEVIVGDNGYTSVSGAVTMKVAIGSESVAIGYGNTLIIEGVTFTKGTSIDVFGKLEMSGSNIISSGSQLNIYDGAVATVEGTLEINGTANVKGELTNNGAITVKNTNGGAKLVVTGKVINESTVIIQKAESSAAIKSNDLDIGFTNTGDNNKFVNKGILTITGTMKGVVDNFGELTFNGTAGANAYIRLYDGTYVNVVSVSGTLVIFDDAQTVYEDTHDGKGAVKKNTGIVVGNAVTLQNVRQVIVSESVTAVVKEIAGATDSFNVKIFVASMKVETSNGNVLPLTDTDGTYVLTVASTSAGNKQGSVWDDPTKGIPVTVTGKITVSDMALGKRVQLTLNGSNTIDIAGEVRLTAEKSDLNNTASKAKVSGSVTIGPKAGPAGNGAVTAEGILHSGQYSVTDDDANVTKYFKPIATAIGEAYLADDMKVYVVGDNTISSEVPILAGVYVSALNSSSTLSIYTKGVVTVEREGLLDMSLGATTITGKLIIKDKNTGLRQNTAPGKFVYEVYTENGDVATYTGVLGALEDATAGTVITIQQNASISESAVIKEGVTLVVPKGLTLSVGSSYDKVVLTVNGELDIMSGGVVTKTGSEDIEVIINGVVASQDGLESFVASQYYDDYVMYESKLNGKDAVYLTNMDYAAANCNDGTITIKGNISAGNITIAPGEKSSGITIVFVKHTVSGTEVNSTLNVASMALEPSVTVNTANGEITGTILANTSDIAASVVLKNANGVVFKTESVEDSEGTTDYLYVKGSLSGSMEVLNGIVTTNDTFGTINDKDSILKVGTNGILVVASGKTMNIAKNAGTTAQVTVAGTIIINGTLNVNGLFSVSGTMVVVKVKSGDAATVEMNKNMTVTGILIVSDDETKNGTFNINSAKLAVGTAAKSVEATPALAGPLTIKSTGFILQYPGADISAAKINWNKVTDSSEAVSTDVYVKKTLFVTAYALEDKVEVIGNAITKTTKIEGLNVADSVEAMDDASTYTYWFTDSGMKTKLTTSNKYIGDKSSLYFGPKAATVSGLVTVGTGLDLFIDGKSYESQRLYGQADVLSVGQHTVMIQVKAGYDGESATIKFNGNIVPAIAAGGTITITADMETFTLVADGAEAIDVTPVDPVTPEAESEWTITTILLVILVILIAIMAVIVAIRLNRS